MYIYKECSELSHDEAEHIFALGNPAEICDALVAVAMNDNDWRWSQTQCLRFLQHNDPYISGLSVTCLGHIARIHQKLDQNLVIPALQERLNDPLIGSRVIDAMDDIYMFIGDGHTSK